MHGRGVGVIWTRHRKAFCTTRDPDMLGWALTISSSWFWICLCTSAIWKSTSPAETGQGGCEGHQGHPGAGAGGGVPSQSQGGSWRTPRGHLWGAAVSQCPPEQTAGPWEAGRAAGMRAALVPSPSTGTDTALALRAGHRTWD